MHWPSKITVPEVGVKKPPMIRRVLYAESLMENKDYIGAEAVFAEFGAYKDAEEQVLQCRYLQAKAVMDDGRYEEAKALFEEIQDYSDSNEMILECVYCQAMEAVEAENWDEAILLFQSVDTYMDSESQATAIGQMLQYQQGVAYFESEHWKQAMDLHS